MDMRHSPNAWPCSEGKGSAHHTFRIMLLIDDIQKTQEALNIMHALELLDHGGGVSVESVANLCMHVLTFWGGGGTTLKVKKFFYDGYWQKVKFGLMLGAAIMNLWTILLTCLYAWHKCYGKAVELATLHK